MKANISTVLAELRATIRDARAMPMSASAVINRGEVLAQIEALEAAIDAGLDDATTVVGDRDAVVASAQGQADDILRDARDQQDQLVSDSDVYKVAQQRAREITEQAQREAEELQRETDDYVESQLANFELTLDKTLQTVRRGRARLNEGHSSGLADDGDVDAINLPDHLRRD